VAGLTGALEHSDFVFDRQGGRVDLGAPVRRDAVDALADQTDPQVIADLVKRLSDEHEAVRLSAIRALRGRHEDQVVRALAGGAASWPVPEGNASRTEALGALLDIDDPRTLELLVIAMVHRDGDRPLGEVDEGVLGAVLATDGDTAGDVAWRVVPALSHDRVEVRLRAETMLGWLAPHSVEPLVAALERPEMRGRAAQVLGEVRDSRAVGPLIDMVFDHDPAVRRTVVRALGQIKDPSAALVLLRSSRDPDYGVRSAALGALDELGTAGVMMAIAELQQSSLAQLEQGAGAGLGAGLPIEAQGDHQGEGSRSRFQRWRQRLGRARCRRSRRFLAPFDGAAQGEPQRRYA